MPKKGRKIGSLNPQAQLLRVFQGVRPGEEGFVANALVKLRALRWKVKDQVGGSTECYEKIWEHQSVTDHNAKLKPGIDILSTYYLTLYGVVQEDDLPSIFAHEPFKLLVGRIGNVRTWVLRPPPWLTDDRLDEGQLYFSFYNDEELELDDDIVDSAERAAGAEGSTNTG